MMKTHFKAYLLAICFICSLSSSSHSQTVQLVWSTNTEPDISRYGIYRSSTIDSNFVLINTINHPDSIYLDSDIKIGYNYSYGITAIDKWGNESSLSNIAVIDLTTRTSVELISFSGKLVENYVILEWQTINENTNYGFEVQRSKDSLNFSPMGFIKGNNIVNITSEYHYIDKTNLNWGEYYYRLKQIDYNGSFEYTGVIKVMILAPKTFTLYQNYPNPFNPSTTISYNLTESSDINLTIYNTIGQEVYNLVNSYQPAGKYSVLWDGTNESGNKVPSGVYYYKIKIGNFTNTKKIILMK